MALWIKQQESGLTHKIVDDVTAAVRGVVWARRYVFFMFFSFFQLMFSSFLGSYYVITMKCAQVQNVDNDSEAWRKDPNDAYRTLGQVFFHLSFFHN
jgi:hypothetical protein